MRNREIFLYALWVAAALVLLGLPLLVPGTALANFGDLYTYHYPLRHLVASTLQSGRLPFWNPYVFCGLPLAANPQAVLFYPGGVLNALFPLSLALSWDFAGHLLWAGWGMLLLARRERLNAGAAVFLAAIYGFSPFLIYRITEGIPTLLAALAWVPWCWLAFLSLRPGFLAAAWALQLLSGHPQFLLVNALGMAAWACCRGERLRLMTRFALEGAAAAVLAALQWPATWQFLGHSLRQNWPHAYAAAYSVSPGALLTLLDPNAWGNPWDGTFGGVPSVFFETTGVYVGWLGLGAAGVAWAGGGGRIALLLIGLGAFLALGDHNPLYAAFCPIATGWLRTPARYLFLSLWGLLLAAGAGARMFSERYRPGVRVGAFLVIAAAAQLLAWDRRFIQTQDMGPYLDPNRDLARIIAGQPFRVLTDPNLANPNKTMLYRAMNANGYDAFYLRGYAEFAAQSEGRAAADSSRIFMANYKTPQMSRAAVAYLVTKYGELKPNLGALPLAYFIDAQGKPVSRSERSSAAAAVQHAPRGAIFQGPSVRIPRPELWEVEGRPSADARSLAVTIPAYPGWRAWLNDTPAPLEPYGYFQAVRLPAGLDLVRLRLDFVPTMWHLAVLSALAAWMLWLGLWWREAFEVVA